MQDAEAAGSAVVYLDSLMISKPFLSAGGGYRFEGQGYRSSALRRSDARDDEQDD